MVSAARIGLPTDGNCRDFRACCRLGKRNIPNSRQFV
jgi:hypothetical protein